MSKELFAVNGVFAVIGSTIAKALGGWDVALQVLVALIVIDYITGVVIAILTKTLSSEVGGKGLAKKGLILAILYVAVLVDKTTGTDFIRTLVIMFYIANEGISVLENSSKLGVPYPQKLKDILVQLKKSTEEETK